MTYRETLDFLFEQVPMFQNLGAGAYKPGLDTTLRLAAHWGDPHRRLKAAIHVGGTNGKGSTAHTIAAALQSAGYRTGLYTSPHLIDFRERIRVDGVKISERYVVDFVERYRADATLTALHPTFFELTTIMALRYFADCDVDVAVIEVGLGGRLDCTNIITPVLSVITNISPDHTALLGHTLPEIAREKAGIIKAGVPVVIGNAEGEVRRVLEDKAREVGAPIVFAQDSMPYAEALVMPDGIRYSGTAWGDITGELCGDCQRENGATILTALALLAPRFPRLDAEAVKNGFAHVCGLTGLMGRWMTVSTSPVRVVCDTGHNIGGWEWLGPRLSAIAAGSRLAIVLGFVNDKDVSAIMHTLPRNADYFFATPSVKRGRDAADTAAVAAANGISGQAYATVYDAYKAAVDTDGRYDMVFVGGSTFVVADLLAALDSSEQAKV